MSKKEEKKYMVDFVLRHLWHKISRLYNQKAAELIKENLRLVGLDEEYVQPLADFLNCYVANLCLMEKYVQDNKPKKSQGVIPQLVSEIVLSFPPKR